MITSRALGFTEYYSKFCHDNAGGTNTLVGMARVKGSLNHDVLNRALELMIERHPALRSLLLESPPGDALVEVEGCQSHIPLTVEARHREGGWVSCFEENLQQTFSEGSLPWRITLLQNRGEGSDGKQEIIVAFHHALSDGYSLATFFGELLDYCRLVIEGHEPEITKLPPLPSLEELLGEKMTWPAYLTKKMALSGVQMIKLGKHILRYEEEAPLQFRRARILSCELEDDILGDLLRKCRLNQTTLTGLLTSSLMVATSLTLGDSWRNGKCKHMAMTPVDMRSRCKPRVGLEHLGCYVGFAQTTHAFDSRTDVWELARSFNREIDKFKQRSILPPERYSRKTIDMMLRSLEKGMFKNVFHYGIGVTNIGRLPFGADFNPLCLEAFHFGTSRLWGDWLTLLHCSTLEERLFLNFCYAEPLLSTGSMVKIQNCFLSILQSV